MSVRQSRRACAESVSLADSLRSLLGRWVRTTRERTGTPTTARIETLRMLQAQSLSITALAAGRSVKHQSMRLVIDQLALEGAVSRTIDPGDRRRQIVRITPKGQTILRREQKARTEWIAAALERCSFDEQQQVTLAIRTLEDLLSRATVGKPEPL